MAWKFNTRWTPEELEELRRLYWEMPNAEIADALGRTIMSVTSKASRLGLRKRADQLADMGRKNRALRKQKERDQ